MSCKYYAWEQTLPVISLLQFRSALFWIKDLQDPQILTVMFVAVSHYISEVTCMHVAAAGIWGGCRRGEGVGGFGRTF